ncbi:MAG: lipopolysaccharide kinase InaA family protein [Synechococcaceae cyanobacterium]|nr:lipopolysaccharide kinase InaA family protein [Synechococcaceae cyanobacterium]
MLKQARQRFVCRLQLGATGPSVICKLFPLTSPLSWPRWRKFALREFGNLRHARARGCPAPRPLALFNDRRLGLVRCTGLLMEDLRGWSDLRTVAAAEGPLAAARLAAAALRSMAELGCLHADARDENILVSADRSRWSVIDWQYARFARPDANRSLARLAAFYIYKAPVQHQLLLEREWVAELASDRPQLADQIHQALRRKRSSRLRLPRLLPLQHR